MSEAFQLVAGSLALDFSNTLDNRYDPEGPRELLSTFERFVDFATQTGIVGRNQGRSLIAATPRAEAQRALDRAIELREALYFLFRSVARQRTPPRSCLRTLNRFLAEAHVPKLLAWEDRQYVWRCRAVAGTPAGPLWPIVESAAQLLAAPDAQHIRECSAETCRWLFLDRSKNHSRRWCDMRICGNRAKARRFHVRRSGHGGVSEPPRGCGPATKTTGRAVARGPEQASHHDP
jgi:predicted RNA-binding Zn ribbon-like protein